MTRPDSLVMFFDEARFGLRSTTMRMWAAKGKPLTVKVQQGFKNFYVYSAVSPNTGENFSLILPNVNTTNMNIFLKKIQTQFPQKHILLIMDRAGWHRSKELIVDEKLKIELLPPYSPELNPVEKLWEWIKKECVHNFFYKTLDDLSNAVSEVIQNLNNEKLKILCNCKYIV